MSPRPTTRHPTRTASSLLALMSGACPVPKIVHYHLTVGETVVLPAGSRVLSHKTDYSQGAPRVSLVVEEPGDKPESPLAALAEQWAKEDRERYGAIEEEREKDRRYFGGTQWTRRQMAQIAERSKPSDHAADALGLLARCVGVPVAQQYKRAARDAIPFGIGWVGIDPAAPAREPTPLEAAAKRVRQTTDAFARASKAAAIAEDAHHRAADYRDQCQKAMAQAQDDLTALALKTEG